jgi:hypothetical protein
MKCLVRKTDIDAPLLQFGDVRRPLCQSCYLAGYDFVYDCSLEDYLAEGLSLDDAIARDKDSQIAELNNFVEGMHDVSLDVIALKDAGVS